MPAVGAVSSAFCANWSDGSTPQSTKLPPARWKALRGEVRGDWDLVLEVAKPSALRRIVADRRGSMLSMLFAMLSTERRVSKSKSKSLRLEEGLFFVYSLLACESNF